MAGNARFELTSTSPEPGIASNYSNGKRGNFPGPSLDGSGSFREGVEAKIFSSGPSNSRYSGTLMGDLPPLSQSLMLEPIIMADQKYIRSGELRRVLGIAIGSATEDNSVGAAHPKPSPPVAMDEIKRYRSSVADGCLKARGRAKKLDEHLHKLNKYFEAVSCKKQHRSELISNARSAGSNLKMGIHRNPTELVTQRLEEQAKNVTLNKRARTSSAETRPESRGNGMPRQPSVMAKDREMLKDSGDVSDLVEEKIRRLPAGGEGWERKMKRKRSVGTFLIRSTDSGDLTRALHHKLSNDPGLQSCDSPVFRSGSSNGTSGIHKLDKTPSLTRSNARAIPKNEQGKATLPKDLTTGLNKERLLAKGNNKFSIREDGNVVGPGPVKKGKAFRAPRTGSLMATNSAPVIPRGSGVLESCEQPPVVKNIRSVDGASNQKRSMASGSSSPSMAQWVGQRPQKITRTRRANLVSPVSNQGERQTSSEGCLPSDFSGGTNGSLLSRGVVNGTEQFKVKLENVSSPAILPESDESGAGENKLKNKGLAGGEVVEKVVNAVQNVESPVMLTKKRFLIKEETNDGVRRKGRSGRGSAFSRACISPLRILRPASDKNGSKSGRPLKKVSERKGFSRHGNTPTSSSPDFTGESDDDHEELLTAANFACNASYLACSSLFWKKMEPIYASVSLEGTLFLSLQVDPEHGEISISDPLVGGEKNGTLQDHLNSIEPAGTVGLVDQFQDVNTLLGGLDSDRRSNKNIPLYQRVLSALIADDEIEEFDENSMERSVLLQCDLNDSACDTELRKRDSVTFECEAMIGVQRPKQHTANRHSGVGLLDGILRNDLDGTKVVQETGFGISSFDCQYEHMCLDDKLLLELQTIGLYPEIVPDLDDREDEVVNCEIVQLRKGLHQQVGNKRAYLDKIYRVIQGGREAERRYLELIAMDRLVELAYKKLLATRGTSASRSGVAKVSKPVALAFLKRTLSRCRKFEDPGLSCFSEPTLQDIILSPPPRGNEAEALTFVGSAISSLESRTPQPDPRVSGVFSGNPEWPDLYNKLDKDSLDASEALKYQFDRTFAKNGPTSNRVKKKEVLLDDVGGGAASGAPLTLGGTLLGGTKGKRSDRDRDKDISTRNAGPKANNCPSVGNFKGVRKTKTKPKQKTAQLSTSENGFASEFAETPVYHSARGSGEFVTNTNKNRKQEIGLMTPSGTPKEIKEPMDVTNIRPRELDSIEESNVDTDLASPQDLNSWFNFDEDGLLDHDSMGLEIPMDDLTDLNMF